MFYAKLRKLSFEARKSSLVKRFGTLFAALVSLFVFSAASRLPIRGADRNEKNVQPAPPTFYKDVLPILQQHCQVCHRTGEIAPMPLVTYEQAHHWSASIRSRRRR